MHDRWEYATMLSKEGVDMRKFIGLFIVVLILASFSACAPTKTVSDKQAQKDVQNVLGEYEKLPMDMEQVKDKLSDSAVVQSPSEEGDATEVVVSDNVAVYYVVIEDTATYAEGKTYSFKITIMHLGSSREGKDNVYDLHFIGANFTMELEGEDVSAIRQELSAQIDQMDLSQSDAAKMKDLINGKQVYADTKSRLWEMYSEVDVDVKATYDTQTGTFAVREEDTYDEMYDQYSYAITDFKGREIECVYYKLDNTGKKWITEHYTYKYLPDGTVEKHSVDYWAYTTQIWSEDVTLEYADTTTKCLWRRSYYDNGTLEFEQYYNEEDNYVNVQYDQNGDITTKRIHETDPEGRTLCEEEYYVGGKLWRKFWLDGEFYITEEYFENGCLSSYRKIDPSLQNEALDLTGVILSKKGFEDGSVNVTEYHANGERKSLTNYSSTGEVTDITYFDEAGNVIH